MKRRFWLIYLILIGVIFSGVYIFTADLKSSPFAISEEQMAVIRGSTTYQDQKCTQVGGCSNLDCIVNSSQNFYRVGNPYYKECKNSSGNTCTEYGSTWNCMVKVCDNNCQNCGDWQYDTLPDCQ